jgi:hypothetical protein
MALVAAETRKQQRRKHQQRSWDALLAGLVAAVAFVSLMSIFGPTILLAGHPKNNASILINSNDNNNNAVQDSIRRMNKPRPVTVEVDDLDHESLFRKVTKSCLPIESKKCGEYVPDPIIGTNKPKVQRVAILAPPGDLSGSLMNRVERIVQDHNKVSSKEGILSIELVTTSHVPPYGYGKSHGYTKIIRLIPEPLLLEVADALTAVLFPGESHTQFTVSDVKAALRMILRFHCRLSHVAAHTALLSVKFMDLLADPIGTTQIIRNFLSPSTSRPNARAPNGNNKVDADSNEIAEEFSIDDDQSSLMDAELAYGSQILTHIQLQSLDGGRNRTVGRSIMDVLDQVLLDEFKKTKDMTAWPCLSFWASNDNAEPLSDITKRLAQKLSPNCDDRYNTCFVKRDLCEFNGDALCVESKS